MATNGLLFHLDVRSCVGFAAFLALTVTAFPADKKAPPAYIVEVMPFEVKEGVDLPIDFGSKFSAQLVHELQKTKKFKEIVSAGETPTDAHAPAMRLTGVILEFRPGSRAKRYLVGLGSGAAVAVAHFRFVDRASGDVKFDGDLEAKMKGGAFGGSASGTASELAREFAKIIKQQRF